MNLDFTDRLSYLTWAAGWKSHYKHVSQEIRKHKLELANLDRAGEPSWRAHADLRKRRAEANELLAVRIASKVKAGEQRAASRLSEPFTTGGSYDMMVDVL